MDQPDTLQRVSLGPLRHFGPKETRCNAPVILALGGQHEMTIPSDLHVLAQIAITLAGFTGIIGVFQRRGGSVLSEREKLHIINLLQATTIVVFLSFVPSCLLLIPIPGLDYWQWSMRLLLAVHVIAWMIGTISIRRFFAILGSLPPAERIILFGFFIPVGIFAVVVEAE